MTFKIASENTKHQSVFKFNSNLPLSKLDDNFEYNNTNEANNSPLAKELFLFPFVKSIFISQNFIGIEAVDGFEWGDTENEVASYIEDYLNDGKLVIKPIPKEEVDIYLENTPNPETVKFVANKTLFKNSYFFRSLEEASLASTFVKGLFELGCVKEVFCCENYISITKESQCNWLDINDALKSFILNFLKFGIPLIEHKKKDSNNLDQFSTEIVDFIERNIQPQVSMDGGHILFESYDENSKTVKVLLQGACSGCPSSTFTLKNGIEQLLRSNFPEKVDFVEAANEESAEHF